MNYFSTEFIEQVRLASDIISFIAEDTSLKGQGDRYMGLCPFPDHNEKTSSFSVSQSKQVYNCFGCQKSGNIYTYLQELRGMNFVESVHYLARQAGIEIPKGIQKNQGDSNSQLIDVNEKTCQFYESQLRRCPPDHPVVKYLNQRGYNKEVIKTFRLGYAPNGNALLKYLNSDAERKAASSLGLLGKSTQGSLYDNFHNRLMFPIVSTRKQVIGFGARALDNSLPKYINSKQSPIFNKGNSFYGLSDSARYLKQKGFLLVVEGYTDFLSLWQAGFKNVVATLGTALTTQHAKTLKRYVDSVMIVFDGDQAGLKASERSLPLLLEESLEAKTICLPNKQDPDDFIKQEGKKSFETAIKDSKDLFFQVLQNRNTKIKSEGKNLVYLLEEMVPFLQATKKESLFVIYKQRLLDMFGTDKKSMERVLNNFLKTPSRKKSYGKESSLQKEADTSSKDEIHLSKSLKAERLLLVLSLDSPHFLDLFMEEQGLDFLETESIAIIFKKIIEEYGQNTKKFDNILHSVMNKVSDKHLLLKETYLVLKGAGAEDLNQIFADSLAFLKKKKISAKVNQLITEIKMGGKEDIRQLEKVFQLTKEKLRQKAFSKK